MSDVIDNILSEVASLSLLREPRRIPQAGDSDWAVLEGEVQVAGREVTLQVILDSSFPLSLPSFVLRPWDALGFIPHINPWGVICFTDPEGLVLDRRRPLEIVQDAFQRVLWILTEGVLGRNRGDFADEFEVYWSRISADSLALSVLDLTDQVEEIVVSFEAQSQPRWIARRNQDIQALLNRQHFESLSTIHGALYLPLAAGTTIIPPRPDEPFWTADQARRILLGGLSRANRTLLQKLTDHQPASREYLIVGLPRPAGGISLFGLLYNGVGTIHPLREGGSAEHVAPFLVQRLDRQYLVQRGGGYERLDTKHVLVAGCGAVGGRLALELIQAGVLNLTLLDHDILKPENTYRHILGRRYWGTHKARALKNEIEANYPYVQITATTKQIEQALADGTIHLADYDLVVLALGHPTVELEINERIHALSNGPAAVFTWVEPLGIGGHALLTGNGAQPGCFECLYTSPEDGEAFRENRAAFAAPGQSFGRALSGCGSLHTPYGSMDATQTTTLAARLVIDALTGREGGNPLRSWKGNAGAFQTAGFRLSYRYTAPENELAQQQYSYQLNQCRICGSRSRGIVDE